MIDKVVSYKILTLKDIPLVISTLTTARLLRYNAKIPLFIATKGLIMLKINIKCGAENWFSDIYEQKGTPLYNAVIESLHARLKNNLNKTDTSSLIICYNINYRS